MQSWNNELELLGWCGAVFTDSGSCEWKEIKSLGWCGAIFIDYGSCQWKEIKSLERSSSAT